MTTNAPVQVQDHHHYLEDQVRMQRSVDVNEALAMVKAKARRANQQNSNNSVHINDSVRDSISL